MNLTPGKYTVYATSFTDPQNATEAVYKIYDGTHNTGTELGSYAVDQKNGPAAEEIRSIRGRATETTAPMGILTMVHSPVTSRLWAGGIT